MADIKWRFWQDIAKRLVDRQDGTHAERVEAYPPVKLMTDDDGTYARIRVDVGQTGFFAGREFRTLYEFSIASGATQVIKVVAPVATVPNDIILFETSITTEDSTIEMQLRIGGTANGAWTSMPVFRKNTMSVAPIIANQVTLDYDGAHTGGTLIDINRVPANNKGSSFGGTSSERGVGAGIYYYVLTNVGNQTATVVFNGYWEERQ